MIDDIVKKILKNPEDTLIFKIDVVHDPVCALKFSIFGANNYYLDPGIAFGQIHGSSAC